MISKMILPMLLLGSLALRSEDAVSVRGREHALAAAIELHDRNMVTSLVGQQFHVSWDIGSAIQHVQTEASRQEWMDGMDRLRVESYRVEIKSVQVEQRRRKTGAHASALVDLIEHWTVNLAGSGRTQKDIETVDRWIRGEDGWKLASRASHYLP